MVLSKREINIKRLLAKCELMLKNDSKEFSLLEKLIINLQDMIADIMSSPERPFDDVLSSYCERLEQLKGSINSEFINEVDLKANNHIDFLQKKSFDDPKLLQRKLDEESHMNLRQQLFSGQNLRKRKDIFEDNESTSDSDKFHNLDIDAHLKYHNSLQEKIADNMISLVQNIKKHSILAGDIIQKDVKVIGKSLEIADKNHKQLDIESDKLKEQTNKSCSFWIVLLLAVVLVIFISMVIFIKVMKKI